MAKQLFRLFLFSQLFLTLSTTEESHFFLPYISNRKEEKHIISKFYFRHMMIDKYTNAEGRRLKGTMMGSGERG